MDAELVTARELVGRNGAMLVVLSPEVVTPLAAERRRTRRGARDAFARLQRRLLDGRGLGLADEYPPDSTLLIARVERGAIVDRIRAPLPGGGGAEPDGGVREPRRPLPPTSGAAAAADAD